MTRRGTAADALARMQRVAGAASPVSRQPMLADEPTTPGDAAEATREVRGSASSSAPDASPVLPVPTGGTPEKTIRTTLDLDPDRYQVLRQYSATHRCKGAEVLRALLDELGRDPALDSKIAHRLRNERASLR